MKTTFSLCPSCYSKLGDGQTLAVARFALRESRDGNFNRPSLSVKQRRHLKKDLEALLLLLDEWDDMKDSL